MKHTTQVRIVSGPALIFIALLLMSVVSAFALPYIAFAASCSPTGYTVEYINGVLETPERARDNVATLQLVLDNSYNYEPLTVALAYNPVHLAGVGDLLETLSQLLFEPISQYDFHNIIEQVAANDTTHKLLVVGHSQGALYANSLYEYLIAHGEPPRSVGVYAVATPASYVAGGGPYINSQEDAVLYTLRSAAKNLNAPAPLPINLDLPIPPTISDLPSTHAFSTYLMGARPRMVSEIQRELDMLQSQSSLSDGACIASSPQTVLDFVQKMAFSIADPAAEDVRDQAKLVYTGITSTVSNVYSAVHVASTELGSALAAFTKSIAASKNSPVAPQNQEKNFGIVKKFYGSSIDQATYDELNNNQGGAVALAQIPPKSPHVILGSVAVSENPTSSVLSQTKATPTPASAPTAPPGIAYLPPNFISGGGLPPIVPTFILSITSPIPPLPIVADATSTATSTPAEATTTPPIVEDIPPLASSTPTSTPPIEHTNTPGIADTFDTFNSLGWQVFGLNATIFKFDDGSDGSCFKGGCAVADSGLNSFPTMYLQLPTAYENVTFPLHIKVSGIPGPSLGNPHPLVSLCIEPSQGCANGTLINFPFNPPIDNAWHQYLFMWQQHEGQSSSCVLMDETDISHCTWISMDVPPGSVFDGIALWSGTGYQPLQGSGLWFDELGSQ